MEQMTSICDMVGQYMQMNEEDRRIAEDLAAKDQYWKIPICYNDDDDDVEDLVPIPSELEGISEDTCDVPVGEDSSTFDALSDHSEILSDSNNDGTSRDDNDFEDIEYVDASPTDSELVSLEEIKPDQDELTNVVIEEVDTFLVSEDSIPPGIESNFDPGGGEIVVSQNVEDDDSFTSVIRTFLPFLTYPKEFADELAHHHISGSMIVSSLKSEPVVPVNSYYFSPVGRDTMFDLGITQFIILLRSVSHREWNFMKFKSSLSKPLE
ncbi:hypothetical protein Tco_1345702 [Tanacetum coccineum]